MAACSAEPSAPGRCGRKIADGHALLVVERLIDIALAEEDPDSVAVSRAVKRARRKGAAWAEAARLYIAISEDLALTRHQLRCAELLDWIVEHPGTYAVLHDRGVRGTRRYDLRTLDPLMRRPPCHDLTASRRTRPRSKRSARRRSSTRTSRSSPSGPSDPEPGPRRRGELLHLRRGQRGDLAVAA